MEVNLSYCNISGNFANASYFFVKDGITPAIVSKKYKQPVIF